MFNGLRIPVKGLFFEFGKDGGGGEVEFGGGFKGGKGGEEAGFGEGGVFIEEDSGHVKGKGEFDFSGGGVTTEGLQAITATLELGQEEVIFVFMGVFVGDLEEETMGSGEKELFVLGDVFGGTLTGEIVLDNHVGG